MYALLDLFGSSHFVECAVMAYVAITAEEAFAVANNGFTKAACIVIICMDSYDVVSFQRNVSLLV